MKSTKKLQGIIEKIERLALTKVTSKTADADFITTVYAINQYCNLADSLGNDRADMRKRLNSLYAEFSHRVYSKRDIQSAYDLIDCLHSFIYGRDIDEADRGPKSWRLALAEMSLKAIAAYRKEPKLQAYQYVNLLMYYGIQCKDQRLFEDTDAEVKELAKQQFKNLSVSMSDDELMNLIMLRKTVAAGYFYPVNDFDGELTDAMEALVQRVNVKSLSDEQLKLWVRVAGVIDKWKYYFATPTDNLLPTARKELMRRSSLANSITALSWDSNAELARIREAEYKRKIAIKDKYFSDDFLREVLDIDINNELLTKSLLALLSIYKSRYEIASVVGGQDDVIAFCKRRLVAIFNLLVKRYAEIDDVLAKIEVLNAIQSAESLVGTLGDTRDTMSFVYRNVELLSASEDELPEQTVQMLKALENGKDIEFSCTADSEDELVALAAQKAKDVQYEIAIYTAAEQLTNGSLDIDAAVCGLNYLIDKAKRTNDSQTSQIRHLLGYVQKAILSEDTEIYDEENEESYCKVICPISTQSLIALIEADLYLLSVDDEYVDTDECVHTCDITYELEQRHEDPLAASALNRYRTRLHAILAPAKA